jgi:hypothetical protein
MKRYVIAAALLLLLASLGACAGTTPPLANLTGTWTIGPITNCAATGDWHCNATTTGTGSTMAIQETGDSLSITISGDGQTFPEITGTISGQTFSFSIPAPTTDASGQVLDCSFQFTGTTPSPDQMAGTVDETCVGKSGSTTADWSATRTTA